MSWTNGNGGHQDPDGHPDPDGYGRHPDPDRYTGHLAPYGGHLGEFDREWEESVERSWPLAWQGLYARERWLWFDQLWSDVCTLRERYHLPVRSGWWEDQVQVEALAAFAAWVDRYDSGDWDDPPGKLALLYDLERVAVLLRDGGDPFAPERDRPAFLAHLIKLGCQPPDGE